MELIALFSALLLLSAAALLTTADAQLAAADEENENCFARVDEAEWPAQRVLRFNASAAAVVLDLRAASPRLRECLEGDGRAYQAVILRDGRVFDAAPLDLAAASDEVKFEYAVLPGVYSAKLKCEGCAEEVTSHPVHVVGEDCDAVKVPPSVAVEQQVRLLKQLC